MRNAIVIGLGGTGSWVLAHLKRRLLTEHRYRLLAAGGDGLAHPDYDTHRWPVISRALDIDTEERPNSGGTSLVRDVEDITLNAPFGQVVNDFRNAQAQGRQVTYPSIARWLPPQEVAQWTILEGMDQLTQAGQVRQFGRIAFFNEVITGGERLANIQMALGALNRADDIQVFVVGSVAGGTGAGIVIDTLAYLQRMRAGMVGTIKFTTLGFFALPTGYSGLQLRKEERERINANGFATLRELKRLLGAPDTVSIEWTANERWTLTSPALDFCYLLDGSRDQIGARQLEQHSPFEEGLPVAMADAIMAHLYTTTSGDLGQDYAALNQGVLNGSERFAAFGSYVLSVPWEPMLQSSSLRATADVLEAMLGETPQAGSDLAKQFLSQGASGAFALPNEEGYLPPIVTYGASTQFELDRPSPTTNWLEPRQEPAQVAHIPNFGDAWPGIGRMRTDYANEDVRTGVSAVKRDFFGELRELTELELQSDLDAPLLPGYTTNVQRATAEFRRALWIATAAVLRRNDRRGSLNLGLAFLTSLRTTFERFAEYVASIPPVDLQPYEQVRENAEIEMNDSKSWDDAFEQRAYIRAEQELTEQAVSNQRLDFAVKLAGRLVAVTDSVLTGVRGWRDSLESLLERAVQQREKVDQQRTKDDSAPTRRFVPLPGDPVEDQLFTASWTAPDGEGLDGLTKTLMQLSWTAAELGGSPEIRLLVNNTQRNDVRPVTLTDFTSTTARRFISYRDLSVFRVLSMQEAVPEALAGELDAGGARLSAFNPVGQAQAQQTATPVIKRYVWAPWPADDDSEVGVLGSRVRSILEARTLSTRDLIDDQAGSADKIIVFTTHHLLALEAFEGVQMMRPAYIGRREASPSPHVMPEEAAAVQLEMASVELARAGLLKGPVEELPSDAVRFAPHQELLRALVICLAIDSITLQNDVVSGVMNWQLRDGERTVDLGDDDTLDALVDRLVRNVDDFDERMVHDALTATARANSCTKDLRDRLQGVGRSGPSVQCSQAFATLMSVQAATIAASLA